jgi:4-amino-4-deoxy-L-arabinose transferase-like glycosyltransferase
VAERRTGARSARRVWWFASFLAVPTALAGLALVWPGHEIADVLRERSEAALAGAGIGGVTVAVDGRDARLRNVPLGAGAAAVAAVGAVPGVREVWLETSAPPAPRGTAPTATVPTAPAEEDAPPVPESPGPISIPDR